MSRCFYVATLLASLSTLVVGCGKTDDGRVPTYPTSGRVTVNGQPAVGAKITLFGASDELLGPKMPAPYAIVGDDGDFSLTSFKPNDGAPAGEFNVAIIWHEEIPEGVDSEMYEPKDRLNGQYSDPEKSGLSATVPAQVNELPPFELEGPR